MLIIFKMHFYNYLVSTFSDHAKLIVNIPNMNSRDDLKNVPYQNFANQRKESCSIEDLVLKTQNMKILFNEKSIFQ